jgi:hypothetical protein
MSTLVRDGPRHHDVLLIYVFLMLSHSLYLLVGLFAGWVIILGLCIGIVIIIVVLAWLAANYNFSCCSADADRDASHGSVEKKRRPRSAGNSSLV